MTQDEEKKIRGLLMEINHLRKEVSHVLDTLTSSDVIQEVALAKGKLASIGDDLYEFLEQNR